MLIIHTTTPTKKEAKRLIKLLLESSLVACAQYCKITSQYVWQNSKAKNIDSKNKKKYCKQREYLLILKTLKENYNEIEKLLLNKHSYEVPEIIAFEAKTHESYNKWLQESCK